MEDALTYNVVSSGNVISEFDFSEVQHAVADLFKISPEKAGAIVSKRTTIKKDLNQKKADAYKQKLESIGLEIELKANKKAVVEPLALSLEPIDGDIPVVQGAIVSLTPVSTKSSVTCGKCQQEQEKSDQCINCGVYFHKISPVVKDVSANEMRTASTVKRDALDVQEVDSLKLNGIVVGVVVAVLGALLWKAIALAFNYELGLIAWGIGGAIGLAVAFTGSKGEMSGIACGSLALVAILGGKYMTVESFQEQWSDPHSGIIAKEIKPLYEGQVEEAKIFSEEVKGRQSLRQFMVDYGYSEEYESKDVTDEEIALFEEDVGVDLEAMSNGTLSYEQWYAKNIQAEIMSYSVVELMKDEFGVLDLLFLLMGVGTAFRLGRGQG